MSQSVKIEGGMTDEVFQEPGLLWERSSPVDTDFDLFTF